MDSARGGEFGSRLLNDPVPEVLVLDVEILKIVGWSAVGALVLGWLAVSFMAEGRARSLTARLGSFFLYLALACLFTALAQDAWAEGRTALLIPFGFLWLVFLAGLVVSLVKWIGELRGGGPADASATH
jgi:hypothetical protein